MLRSLRLRLAIGSFLAIGLALMVLWFSVGYLFINYVGQQFKTEMNVTINTIASRLKVENGKIDIVSPPADPRFSTVSGGRYWQVWTPDGRSLRSRSLWDVELPKTGLHQEGPFDFSREQGPDGEDILLLRSEIKISDEGIDYPVIIYAGFPLANLMEPLDQHRERSRSVMLITALVLLGAALLQARVVLQPLTRVRNQVSMVRAGQLRVMDDGVPIEVMPLVEEINLLLTERQYAIEKARSRASDLAHGLKTPLTVLAQLVQHLPPAEREAAFEQINLVRQRADRQLQAARLGVEQMQVTDMESLIGKLVKVLDPIARARDLAWDVDVEPGLAIEADAADLAEAIGNILDNATKWASSIIHLRAFADRDMAMIVIGDDGPGVRPQDRQQVLRRGEFLDSDQGGSGLGLAICADIMTAYGGNLSLDQADIGGLLVTLQFPRNGGRQIPAHPI
ncbi:sensor histidine kinase [Agrobacterium vitis]|uniref:sensor histidine kinase n=1 Tax=Agrobacterium vitis TaxID=373 RepID=UPI002033A6BB|nr:HAMP domain-containing sensor histidine kinase [Agrobacterium vitis]MCM2449561.1 HAMP domain-containing histidine kinase [Agrobacterium vitis]